MPDGGTPATGSGRLGQSDASLADEVRAVERARLHALVAGDIGTARLLHASDFHLVTPSGKTHSRESYLGAIASGDLIYLVFEPISEIDVRLYEPGAAVIRYRSRIEMEQYRADCWHTDTYERCDDRWQIVWSQATEIR